MFTIKNLHLAFSAIVVVAVGLSYGIIPNKVLPFFFTITVESTDLKNVFRAIMGLYIGLAMYWVIGLVKPIHWKYATLTCTIFMGGLAFGRILSILLDGVPSLAFIIGTIFEILLMIWGIINLQNKKYRQ